MAPRVVARVFPLPEGRLVLRVLLAHRVVLLSGVLELSRQVVTECRQVVTRFHCVAQPLGWLAGKNVPVQGLQAQ